MQNPDNKPLGQLFIGCEENGEMQRVPALDKRWIRRTGFSKYVGLVSSGGKVKTGVDLQEWTYAAEGFAKNMSFLLQCTHNEFWSHMVYEKSALGAILSFLQRATPFYLDISHETEETDVLYLYEHILNLVIRILCRLTTDKESESTWITREHLGELLYSNFLISVPMLLDLIIALGDVDEKNFKQLIALFEQIITLQPRYREDLSQALLFFRTAFRTIQTQSENEGFDGAGGGAMDDNLDTPYDDVVLFTLDTAYTLSILLEISPDSLKICHDIKLGPSIAQFYDNTIPFLYKNIFLINGEARSLNWLNMARVQFLRAFRSISNSYLMAVLVKPDESFGPSEDLVALLMESLAERIFVIDYQREYPIELDMDILKQACAKLDKFKVDYVIKGYQQEAECHSVKLAESIVHASTDDISSKQSVTSEIDTVNGVNCEETSKAESERNIDEEISSALDILPHLGTGFIRRVLFRYENSEDAIAAILEENLPPDLASADRFEVHIPSDPQDVVREEAGIRRLNVFDGDPYDVMTQDNPQCIIKQGKGRPDEPQNAMELLDDKRHVHALKQRYQEYGLVEEADDSYEYKDEYDDSYDALLESETRSTTMRAMKGVSHVEEVKGDSTDDNDSDNSTADNNKTTVRSENGKAFDFCENPEIVRARYADRLAAKRGGVATGSGSGRGNSQDVIGAPKGKGQSADTVRNRDKKKVQKSTRANHNRKAGAAFKRSKGMVS